MAEPLPLPTLLSQVLVALVIELDNRFEARMPSVTNVARPANADPAPAGWGYKPWLISWAMWANFLRYVGEDGASLADVRRRSRLTPQNFKVALAGLSRWGYVAEVGGRLRLLPAGRGARQILQGLEDEIVGFWSARFGEGLVGDLRLHLEQISRALDNDSPAFLPILGYDLTATLVTLRQAGGPRDADPEPTPLTTLLSRVLLAFTLAFETGFRPALAHCANLVRVLTESGVPYRELSRLTGLSLAALTWILNQLVKSGLAETFKAGTVKHVRLTPEGLALRALSQQRIRAIELDWRDRFGADAVEALRSDLAAILASPRFAEALEPPPRGWRAQQARLETLPHHPMVLHRGGYPDGS